jgi:N-acyl-L-homoserine lactone synthetase
MSSWIAAATSYANHMETDEYDDNSIHLAITENDEFVGYTRLVLPCEKFPMERSNVLPSCFERSRSVETSRALVIKEKRHSDIVWHLFNSVYRFCQDIDFANILSFSNAVMYNGYKKRGVPFSYVGEPVLFHGQKSYPLVIAIHPGSYDFTQKQQLVKH